MSYSVIGNIPDFDSGDREGNSGSTPDRTTKNYVMSLVTDGGLDTSSFVHWDTVCLLRGF